MIEDDESNPKHLFRLQERCVNLFHRAQQQAKEQGSPDRWNKHTVDEIEFLVTMQQLVLRGSHTAVDQLVFTHIYAITAEIVNSRDIVEVTSAYWSKYK